MKKLFILLFALTTVAMTSCKKENDVQPSTKNIAPVISEGKRDLGRWD